MRPEHERLEVYQQAVRAASAVEEVARRVATFRPDLADQVRRSSASVVLNIAEGATEFSAAEKGRFYRIARRSAAETLAGLDLIERIHRAGAAAADARSELLWVLGALLTMVRNRARR